MPEDLAGTERAGSPGALEVKAADEVTLPPEGEAPMPVTYSLELAPVGAQIDPNTGLLTWTPAAGDVGSNNFIVRATDDGGLFADQAFTVIVAAANQAPVFTSTPVTVATEGVLYSYQVTTTP